VEGDFKSLAKDCEMQNISAVWLYPIILIAGALQAWGPPMNHNLRLSLENPWLASLVSFLPIVALLACLIMCLPHPLPSERGLAEMPWWAPLGGVVGAFAVIAGLLFVGKVGAGAFPGLTITANILMSLVTGWECSACKCTSSAQAVLPVRRSWSPASH
jgi:transporter family-2 protein